MARSSFLLLVLLAILLSNACQGHGRRVKFMRHSQEKSLLEVGRIMQEMTEMDYKEPGANTNPRGGPLLIFPPSPSSPPLLP
ncbi:hypothetical protein KSP40_PGU016571 [Platanthera guangdongensis]|uniref:Uncharacterized protein n=1 Tax=Platanthera guangdongensis TaxID=2320717 RepID=A0ABR2LPY1_9ASPA